MMRFRAAIAVAAGFALAGCLQGERVIHVEADGSGRIEDTVKLVGPFAEMLSGFGDDGGDSTPEQKLAEKKEKASAAAAKMGEGVKLVSFEEKEDGTEKSVYAFDDVTKLSISDTPSPSAAGGNEEEGGGPAEKSDDNMSFRLERNGDETTLTVVSAPESKSEDAGDRPAPSAEEKAQMVGMFKNMFQGAHVRSVLEVGGEIVETNSPHRDGSTITLLEIDFDDLMADPDSLEALATSQDRPSRDDLAKIKGITVSSEPELVVRFHK